MWHRRAWIRGFAVAVVAVGAAFLSPPAMAAPPQIDREVVDDTFDDDFLSEACGVDVVTRAQGRVTERSFERDGTGLRNLRTLNITLTATAGDNSIRFRDVGADVIRVTADGTMVLSIIGQVPFDFTGILKINLDTGDVIQEPQHFTGDTTRACAKLTA